MSKHLFGTKFVSLQIKVVEKLRGCTYIITYIAAANFLYFQNWCKVKVEIYNFDPKVRDANDLYLYIPLNL